VKREKGVWASPVRKGGRKRAGAQEEKYVFLLFKSIQMGLNGFDQKIDFPCFKNFK
jgi:hypothetical protein